MRQMITKEAVDLMQCAQRKFKLSQAVINCIVFMAECVRLIDRSAEITSSHIAEAVYYATTDTADKSTMALPVVAQNEAEFMAKLDMVSGMPSPQAERIKLAAALLPILRETWKLNEAHIKAMLEA